MNEYTSFQSFSSEEEAAVLVDLLRQKGIDTILVKSKPVVDEVIIGNDLDNRVYVNIKRSDFKHANEIIEEQIKQNISQIGDDYYLYSFSNAELLEIINKPDEWSKQDFFVAKKILAERNIHLSDQAISEITWKRVTEISEPEKSPGSWIILGYFLAFFGGLFGLFFGLPYMTAKKILPDGTKVFVYDQTTRVHGRNIFIISCICIFLSLVLGLEWRFGTPTF
jgi:hypothetical protein